MMEHSLNPADRLEALLTRKGKSSQPDTTGHKAWCPLGDVKQTVKQYIVLVDLPGIDEDTVCIDFHDKLLVISGEREFDHDREDAEEYTRIDRPYGAFRFEVPLEEPVDVNEISAKYKRGVLTIMVPRQPKSTRVQIDVK